MIARPLFLLWCGLVFIFLVAPILAIVPLSFSAGAFLTYPIPGISLRWYEAVLGSDRWMTALRNSLVIGLSATVLATLLGTPAAIALARSRGLVARLAMAVILSPMIVPVVLSAVGLYFFFAPMGLTNSFTALILAHTVLGAPFVVVTVSATLEGFDQNLMRAAASLGAAPLLAFRRVMLPIIAPGVASGALFAFATSFDEVVAVLLLAGPAQRTLTREMFSGIREDINPSILAAACLMIALSLLLFGAIEVLRRRGRARMRG
jgi:putative spermidine/putrescine transport system permease protein